MAFNINEFKSQIASHGLAKNNLFFARLTLPPSLSHVYTQAGLTDTEMLSFMCKAVSIPSFALNTVDVRPLGFGKPEMRPVEFHGGDLSAIFMVDSNFAVTKFFHRWMQSITNFANYHGTLTADPQNKLPYEFDYKENYAAAVFEILVFSGNDANKVYYYKFGNVYPINIGQVDMAWENNADVLTLPVGFAYDKIDVEGAELGAVQTPSYDGNGIVSYLSSIIGYAQLIRSIDTPTNIQDAINLATTVNTIYNTL